MSTFLSTLVTVGTGREASLVPSLVSAYPDTGYSLLGSGTKAGTGRVPVSVPNSPAALLTDWRYPAVRPGDDPTSVAGYRNAMLDAVANWHDDQNRPEVLWRALGLVAGTATVAQVQSAWATVAAGLLLKLAKARAAIQAAQTAADLDAITVGG